MRRLPRVSSNSAQPAHQRHARLAADQDHLVQVFGFELSVRHRAQAILSRAGNNVAREILQLRASESVTEAEVRSEKRQRDGGLRFRGQGNLGLFRRLADAREGGESLAVAADVSRR